MPHAERDVMRGSLLRPQVHEGRGVEIEFQARVGVADLKCRAGNRLAFSGKHFELPASGLRHPQNRDGASLDLKFYGDSVAALAVKQP